MNGFFYVVVFYIRNDPHVAWIFSKGISRKLSRFWALEVFFSGVFLRHANGVKIEFVIVAFGEP